MNVFCLSKSLSPAVVKIKITYSVWLPYVWCARSKGMVSKGYGRYHKDIISHCIQYPSQGIRCASRRLAQYDCHMTSHKIPLSLSLSLSLSVSRRLSARVLFKFLSSRTQATCTPLTYNPPIPLGKQRRECTRWATVTEISASPSPVASQPRLHAPALAFNDSQHSNPCAV